MSDRRLLENELRRRLPRERFDATLPMVTLANRLLIAVGVDPATTVTGNDQLLSARNDAYVVEYALATVGAPRADAASPGEDWHAAQRRLARQRREDALQASRAPLPNSDEALHTDEERAMPEWKRPLPNSREMRDRRNR